MMNLRLCLFGIVVLGLGACAALAGDWPQWRGPERDGVSKETGLLKAWPKGGPKLAWQLKDIGFGYSTPAVAGDRIYLISNEGKDNEYAQALDVNGGKQVWSTKLGKVGPNLGPQYPGSRSTPTVDGELLFALGSDGDLACLEAATGKPRWQKNLRKEFKGAPGLWAYAESPLIDGEILVCTPGGKEATLVALNKKTGEVIWKSPIPQGDQAGYASAIIVEVNGAKEYVQFLQNALVGVDAKTGKQLWRYEKTALKSPANIATPVAHDGFVYSAAGRSGGGLVKLDADNGAVSVKEVYYRNDLPKAIGGAVLVGEHLYGTGTRGLQCIEFKTGKLKWEDPSVGTGSVLYADGMLYVYGEGSGEVALVEANPSKYLEHGKFTPPDQPKRGNTKAWAYPVVANGRLNLRDLNMLWCYDVKAAK